MTRGRDKRTNIMLTYEAKYCREVKFYETSVQLLSTQRENKPKD